jgi:hypothetical protein
MDMANKFLRSVEKRKKKFSVSDVADSCSEISSLDLNDRGSEKSLSLSDFSSKNHEDNSVKTKVANVSLTETELKDLLSGIDSSSDDDDSSISSSLLGL